MGAAHKRSQAKGAAGERMAAGVLRSLGCACIETIDVGWAVVGSGANRRPLYPRRPVAGDLRALHRGRGVLVEVKARARQVAHCDLQAHQHASLAAYAAAGGHAWVAWVDLDGGAVWIMEHAAMLAAGWAPRAPMRCDLASGLAAGLAAALR